MTREELVRLVERILAAEGSEQEDEELMHLLQRNVLHPEICDLIYFSDPPLSPEEIVDRVIAYRPIVPPPPPR